MKLLSEPLIFNTECARYFDTALCVLRSVTLSKRRAMPNYARAQKHKIRIVCTENIDMNFCILVHCI